MLFLLLTNTATATATAIAAAITLLAVRLGTTTNRAIVVLVTGYTITRRKLDFQLDYFVPLFVAPIALSDGKQFAQATSVISWRRRHNDRRHGWRVFRRGFWIRIIHLELKSGVRT